jgi:HAD superfamily hydrolase (TIGR01549 family)
MKFKAVLFDFIGTTVTEKTPNILLACLKKAFFENEINIDFSFLTQYRGRNKQDIIDLVINEQRLPENLRKKIYNDFNKNMEAASDNFVSDIDAEEIFKFLRHKNIKIGLGTGLPRDIFNNIFSNLNWKKFSFDYIGISDELGKSRPDPLMIYDMMKKIGITAKEEFLKVGDTIADIQEGKNAGVKTAVILSGTQAEEKLKLENPDFIITRLTELILLLN